MTVAESAPAPAARRELTGAVLGAAVAGGLALFAGGQPWADVTTERRPPLPPVGETLSGADAAPLVPAAGLVLLAAAVALLAVRGTGRQVVGLLVALAGGVLAWSGIRGLTGDAAAAAEPQVRGATTAEVLTAWPAVALVGGLVGVAVGILVVVRGRTWPAMGRRYERPAGSAEAAARTVTARTDEDRAQDAWKAMDRGEDPTDPRADTGV
ncbi:TIGR02234 family membrane protein [Blastococcus sp. CT_GayMR20]|uniref:Trp biosynthesis-associated membrane protein n=1 Tax=Blastococcus sp. CT_GayMR20 TaxID=2559609 RepID=UPI0010738392|nr:Trp biosynthesis-associated membrane protein [Blastococcus sp. CT_GayMR20]TFV82837.1 TIGR02234 family membrane protein [Blastococcus sp. CT_GayMR20]